MHRIWNIPELVDAIVAGVSPLDSEQAFFDEESEATRRSLAGLARTAPLFFVPASRRLWSEVDAEALDCLLKAIDRYRMPGKDTASSLARYTFEKCIKHIYLCFDYPYLPELAASYVGMIALTDGDLSGPRMPNMAVLDIDVIPMEDQNENDHEAAEYCALAACSLATLWLVPTLQAINIITNPQEMHRLRQKMAPFLFQAVPLRCPGLRKLTLFDPSDNERPAPHETSVSFLSDMCRTVTSLPLLDTFALPWPISRKLLQVLSAHPSLTELSVNAELYPVGQALALQDESPALEETFTSLRRLSISGDGLGVIQSILPDAAQEGGLSAFVHHLEHLSIMVYIVEKNEIDEPFELPSLVARLPSPVRTLKHLHVDFNFDTLVTDEHLLLLAAAVPSLEYLWLSGSGIMEERERSALTMESLVHLVTHCRSLRYLRAHFSHLRSIAIPRTFKRLAQAILLKLTTDEPISASMTHEFIRRLWARPYFHLNGTTDSRWTVGHYATSVAL